MSSIFDIDEKTVWSPGLQTGLFYVAQARYLERLIKCDCGMEEVGSDYFVIDGERFREFMICFINFRWSSMLTIGFEAASFVMLERCGRSLEAIRPKSPELDRSMKIARGTMPRV